MRLLCLGDIAIADDVTAQALWDAPVVTHPNDDLRIAVNWELPLGRTRNPIPRSSGERFLAHPDAPHVLRQWPPGFAALATNHILDGGCGGLVDTMKGLGEIGFVTVGAGCTAEQIAQVAYWQTEEGRLAIVNWVFPETHPDWMAVPGPCCWPGLERAEHTLSAARRRADWVVVLAHWSDELFAFPRPQDRECARALAQIGVDIVVGHHPHVVRGMEEIGSCTVFYSIGDFYFSDIADGHGGWAVRKAPRNREGTGVRITFRRGAQPSCEILSFWQANNRTVPDAAQRGRRRMAATSRPLRKLAGDDYARWYGTQRALF